jgi:hypothetical protein
LEYFLVAPVAVRVGCISITLHPTWDAPSICDYLRPKITSAIALLSERRFQMAQRAIRFSETTDKEIQVATRKRGFSLPTAFIRHSVEQELSGRSEEGPGAILSGRESDRSLL